MALTTTQVNQAFLATLGRPAEGSAATWGSTSLSLGALSDSIFIAENTEDFVESLYTEILGRASDAEGKAFWNSLLATTSKEAVLAQFKAAVIAAGQADPSNADYQSFIAQNKAFVATLYTNLLGRDDAKTADAEGIDFWANALATGMSRGDLISAFVSAALSDPNSDDAQTLNAKLSVADAYTAAFKDFGKDVTADEKKAAYAQLVEQMKEVVAGSTVEEFQDAINQFKGQNQDRKTDVFTKGEDDLDASESTAATTFRGTINISDSDKSTIESGDAATGNSEYAAANTLIVDVKSDGKEKDFNFGTETAGVKVSNVNNLTINNGTADVTLNLAGGDNYTGKVAITGKGDRADVTVAQDVASLNVSTSGTKKAYADTTVAATATLGSFEGSAAVDTLNISGNIAKSINTGDGKDEVTLGTTAKVFEKATISLGGGDDTLTINTSDIGNYNADGKIAAEDLKASVTIDGGAGTKDKLILQNDISKGVKAITGVEFIDSTKGAISAAAADGLKTTVSGGLTINANYKEVKSINLKDIKSFTDNNKTETGSLSLSGITYENITLSSNIKENIVVKAHTAADPKNYAEINKFGEGDTIKVGDLSGTATQVNNKALDLTRYADVKSTLSGKTTGDVVAINDVNGKKAYIWQVLDSNDARLVAIVDKKLKVEAGSFVYDDGKSKGPVDPVIATENVVNASAANTTIAIDKGTVTGGTPATIDATQDFAINASGGTVTINGNGTVDTKALVFAMTNTTFDGASAGTKVTADVYVGGKYENGAIVAGGSGDAVTLTNNMIKGDSDKVAILNTNGEVSGSGGEALFTGGYKLDLGRVDANLNLGTFGSGVTNVNINSYVQNVGAEDSITFKVSDKAEQIIGTVGKDNITLVANTKPLKIWLEGGDDTLDAKAAFVTLDGSSQAINNLATVNGIDKGDKIILSGAAVTVGNSGDAINVIQASNIAADFGAALNTKAAGAYLVNYTGGDDAGQYLVYTATTGTGAIKTSDIVLKLNGLVNSITADANGGVIIA